MSITSLSGGFDCYLWLFEQMSLSGRAIMAILLWTLYFYILSGSLRAHNMLVCACAYGRERRKAVMMSDARGAFLPPVSTGLLAR